MRIIAVSGALFLSAVCADADVAAYRFVWEGGGGYSVQGALAFDADLAGAGLVTHEDVICFAIEGAKDGQAIGRWALGMLTLDTTWRLHFSPVVSAFFVDGQLIDMPQAWNMNGVGDNCGGGGFGLNIGNFAQDICLDGQLVVDSQIVPSAPFPAVREDGYVFAKDACLGPMILSGAGGGVLDGPLQSARLRQ